MARAIDADALQELCNRRIQNTWNSGTAPVSWAEAYADFKDDIDSIPTLTPPNEPLTSDELRQMDGEPVYIAFLPDADGEKTAFWALVAVDEWGEVYLMNNLGGSSAYEEAWADIEAIYRRPPEGEK